MDSNNHSDITYSGIIVSSICYIGQMFPNLSHLLTTTGSPLPPLDLTSSTHGPGPMDTVYQWIFPKLMFEGGQNITGWLFQAESETGLNVKGLSLELASNFPTFTLWKYVSARYGETGKDVYFTRYNLTSTGASFIYKIEGTSPSLYYYGLEQAVVTTEDSIFGILTTNKSIGIHYINATEVTGSSRVKGDVSLITCHLSFYSTSCRNGTDYMPQPSEQYLPMVIPLFGEHYTILILLLYFILYCT